jgi:hypothetical protein
MTWDLLSATMNGRSPRPIGGDLNGTTSKAEVEPDLAIFERDAQVHATTAELVAARHRRLDALRELLARGWPRRTGRARRDRRRSLTPPPVVVYPRLAFTAAL